MNSDYQVLLYYKYVAIDNPIAVMNDQRLLCQKLHLKGRIIIAKEGINGTVEGTKENTEKYIAETIKDPRFADISFKKSVGTGDAFPKLRVKVRDEIVTSDVAGLDPTRKTGKYITAEELHKWFEEKREFYLVDMRNDYEYMSGFFEGSILSGF